MATNSYVQVPPDSTGKKLHTQQHTVGGNTVEVQAFHLADPSNPNNIQLVDVRGQAYTRFSEGSPTMDAFGNLRVGTSQILGGYEYSNYDQQGLFQDLTATGGTVTYNATGSMVVLAATGANGSSVSRTTNRYHFYQPGVGNLAILTLGHGDSGKAGNTRRWGYFDNNNGLFFELLGTSLNVVRRSNVSGSIVEERIYSADWNGDTLDGTGPSGMTIDVTKANFYFIDFAWLGVGIARMGVLSPDGSRWVCHTFQNPNNHIGPYMASGSLPIRYENFNTAATAGTSQMNLICAAVYAENRTDYVFWKFSDIETQTPVTVTTDTPILSMRPKAEVTAGKPNRTGTYPESLNVFVSGGSVRLTIYDDPVLTGATWTINGAGLSEGDIGATAIIGGDKFRTFFVGPGVTNIDLSSTYETNDEGYHRLADNSDGYVFSLVGTKLDGTTVTVMATLNYRELN